MKIHAQVARNHVSRVLVFKVCFRTSDCLRHRLSSRDPMRFLTHNVRGERPKFLLVGLKFFIRLLYPTARVRFWTVSLFLTMISNQLFLQKDHQRTGQENPLLPTVFPHHPPHLLQRSTRNKLSKKRYVNNRAQPENNRVTELL